MSEQLSGAELPAKGCRGWANLKSWLPNTSLPRELPRALAWSSACRSKAADVPAPRSGPPPRQAPDGGAEAALQPSWARLLQPSGKHWLLPCFSVGEWEGRACSLLAAS